MFIHIIDPFYKDTVKKVRFLRELFAGTFNNLRRETPKSQRNNNFDENNGILTTSEVSVSYIGRYL